MALTIELPPREEVLQYNRERWAEVLGDPELAKVPGKVETNRHGQVLMSPPPSGRHSSRQSRILRTLDRLLGGEPLAECPISTSNGVRAADVGWYSIERFEGVEDQLAFETAPEICVEVLSPSNHPELEEKRALYFEAGAEEMWLCDLEGRMIFYRKATPEVAESTSVRCPGFPERV